MEISEMAERVEGMETVLPGKAEEQLRDLAKEVGKRDKQQGNKK